jgi:hypothetical protein
LKTLQPKTLQILGGVLLAVGVVVIGIGVAGQVGSWGAKTDSTAPGSADDGTRTPGTDGSSSSTSTTLPPAEDAAAFLEQLGAALRDGNTDFLVARLNPAVITRYGSAQCLGALAGARDTSAAFTVKQVGDPADFDWTTDGKTITIAEAVTVDVDRVQRGVPSAASLHIVSVNGQFTWLVDCGNPIGP